MGDSLSLYGSAHLSTAKGVQLVPVEVHSEPGCLSCLPIKGGSTQEIHNYIGKIDSQQKPGNAISQTHTHTRGI